MSRVCIDLAGLCGFAALAGGLYLKYGAADSLIHSGGLIIIVSAVAGWRRR